MRNAMRGDMHGSIRKTYVKHKTYRKLNICKTSVFPDVAKSWCSKLYGLCAQTETAPTTPWRLALTRVPKAFGRRRTRRHDGGFDVAGDVETTVMAPCAAPSKSLRHSGQCQPPWRGRGRFGLCAQTV